MTTFQPGDVVRLTGDAWGAELTGTEQVVVAGEFDGDTDRYFIHDGDRYFVGDFAWTAELTTLSPQAALDAILDKSIPAPIDGYQMAPLMSRGWPIPVVARKVDGHWQVKSVGGGE